MRKLLRFYESSAMGYSGTYCGTELLKFEKTIYEAIIILLFICICMSCSTESHQVSVIGQEVSDSFVRVDEKCVDGLYCIEEFYLRDSLLACIDRCDSCVFHAYDLNRNSILFSFGSKGQGPADFIFPFFLSNIKNDMPLQVYDVGLGRFKSLTIGKDSFKLVGSADMPKQLIGSPNLLKVRGGYAGSFDTGLDGLFFMCPEGEKRLEWVEAPKSLGDYTSGLHLRNRLTVNDSLRFFVVGMYYYNKLFLYDFEKKLCKEVQIGKEEIYPDIRSGEVKDNSVVCCADIQSTQEKIYVLLQNRKIGDRKVSSAYSKILVFDWDLNYEKTYNLPRTAFAIRVDEENRFLIYLSKDMEDECVIGRCFLK